MNTLKSFLFTSIAMTLIVSSSGQGIFNKIKQKVDKAVSPTPSNGNTNQTSSSTNPAKGNNTGQGLISTPPDVNQNLTEAEASFAKNKYTDARYSVQQAILGVELEIGKQILKNLPDNINTLKKDK